MGPIKSFFMGALGAIVALFSWAIVSSQYADYRTRAETSGWMLELSAVKHAIEERALDRGTLQGVGDDLDLSKFKFHDAETFEVSSSGQIMVGGGRDGQLVVLTPNLVGTKIAWRCIGGPRYALPAQCRRDLGWTD